MGGGAKSTFNITGRDSLNLSNQPVQNKRKLDVPQRNPLTRECDEGNNTSTPTESYGNDDLSTTSRPPKRACAAGSIACYPTTDTSTQHAEAQHPMNYHPATEHPNFRFTVSHHTQTQESALISQQNPPAPQQRLLSAPQPTPSFPVQDVHEQSRQIDRILKCPVDAYFEILSLANGTDRFSLVEISWLDFSFLVHPRICPLPGAVEALSRVNDAYSWIKKNPGLPQPHVTASPLASMAQDASGSRRTWLAPPTPRGHTAEEPQQSQINSGSQTQPAPQQSESLPTRSLTKSTSREVTIKEEPQSPDTSGDPAQPAPQHNMSWDETRGLDPPPLWTFPARRSSRIYVSNGRPTVRPVVGWQFRKRGGETRVWYNARWRALIQNRPEFQGVYVDEDGWIMPRMSSAISENLRRTFQGQAKFEFNSHPRMAKPDAGSEMAALLKGVDVVTEDSANKSHSDNRFTSPSYVADSLHVPAENAMLD